MPQRSLFEEGDDIIQGNGGDDIICGGLGDDNLLGGPGFDTIFGAQGNDLIAGNLDNTPNSGLPPSFETPQDILDDTRGLRAFGGAGDDVIWGTNRWDRMQGGPGNDRLQGFDGRDRLRGGPGNDLLIGHGGVDDLGAGNGLDTVLADRFDETVRAGAGNDLCSTVTTRATTWFGCQQPFETAANDPLTPALPFPDELVGSTLPTWVQLGDTTFQQGDDAFNSILFVVELQEGLFFGLADFNLVPEVQLGQLADREGFLHWESLTPGEAQAVAQAWIARRTVFGVWDNVIDPSEPYYDEAVAWGQRWLELNPRT